ncbi:MAG: hypothetical protein L3J49_10010 [Desulfobulbaceae bacterium]|nr:hypothetical protein [Desulfobulbaceae bacterium]
MHTTPLTDLNLEDLLPHRGRMLLIRDILEVDAEHAVTRSVVDESWPMVKGDCVHPLVLVELAAQTAGVCNGWGRIQSRGLDSNQMGWLVGIKKTEFLIDTLHVGNSVITRSENTYNFENLREVSCTMYLDETLIGRATLQLFQAK